MNALLESAMMLGATYSVLALGILLSIIVS